jgi:hypothetical protein
MVHSKLIKELENGEIVTIRLTIPSFLLAMKDISTYPAAKIGRFAVDTEFQGCGFGIFMNYSSCLLFITRSSLSFFCFFFLE